MMSLWFLGVGLRSAWALGESADIELLRPTFSSGGMAGIESPEVRALGHLRLGVWTQYTRDPLILVSETVDDLGAVVARRGTATLGGSVDLGSRAAARFSLPLAVQWGSENPDLAGSTLGTGDLVAGVRLEALEAGPATLGVRADVAFPTGTRLSWLGESQPRFLFGGLGSFRLGPAEILVDVGGVARGSAVDTERDFLLGNEFTGNLGVRYHIWPDRTALGVGLLTRSGTQSLFQSGAETSSELLSSLQWMSQERPLRWEAGVGKGLAQGYGTSEFRAFLGVTWVRPPPQPEPAPIPSVIITEEAPVEPIDIEAITEEPWEEGVLARVIEQQIVIRDPIQFEFNTERILPESIPTLQYVAGLLNEDWRIGHLVIEGHASEEGAFSYNYDLSVRRARAVWEELVRAEVHPDRVSYRGMGEVLPTNGGGSEAALASNRRVEFHIVHQHASDGAAPIYRPVRRTPWDGEGVSPQTPVPLREPSTAPGDPLDSSQFLDEDERPLFRDTPAPSPADRADEDDEGEGEGEPGDGEGRRGQPKPGEETP